MTAPLDPVALAAAARALEAADGDAADRAKATVRAYLDAQLVHADATAPGGAKAVVSEAEAEEAAWLLAAASGHNMFADGHSSLLTTITYIEVAYASARRQPRNDTPQDIEDLSRWRRTLIDWCHQQNETLDA